ANGYRANCQALVERRGRRERAELLDLAEAFVIGEEERAILRNGSTHRRAELIALQHRLTSGWPEETDGIQIRVAQEIPRAAVKLVGAALEGCVDDRARAAAVLGARQAGDDFEFG